MASRPSDDSSYDMLAAPSALVFGDDAGRRERLARILAANGLRVVACDGIEAASRRIDAQASTGQLVIDVARDGGAALDRLLAHVARAMHPVPTLVVAGAPMIDVVAARLLDSDVTLLVDPDDREIGAAIGRSADLVRTVRLEDSAGETSSRRLAQLSEEVGRIARALASLSGNDAATPARPANDPASAPARDPAADLGFIRALLRMRRLREQFLDAALFADPAWDMLLDLAAAELERRPVAVSSLCIAAAVPPTTALRWISTMTRHGLLVRTPDSEDGRRVFVALSPRAAAAMDAYLGAAAQVMRPAR